MANGSDIDEVLRPLNILRGDIWERSLTDRLLDWLLDRFLAETAEHRIGKKKKKRERDKERKKDKERVFLRVRRRIRSGRTVVKRLSGHEKWGKGGKKP